MNDLNNYNHQTPITVRFHDLDALGHVNNARYLNYLEQARLMYARDVWGWDGKLSSFTLIIASVSIDFKQPIHLEDTLTIHTRVVRLGNKSFDMEYLFVLRPGGEDAPVIAAEARVTLVTYDYTDQKTVPIFTTWREAMLAHEPDLFD